MFKGILGSSKKKDDWKSNLDALHNRPAPVNRTNSVFVATEKSSDVEFCIYNAARKGDLKEVRTCLKDWLVHINRCDGQGESGLHCAARNGSVDIVELLLEHKASPNTQNQNGMSPLHEAVKLGNVVIAKKLLENGADPCMKRLDGATPEDLAPGNKEMQELFRKHHIHRMTQQRANSKALLPARARAALNLLATPYLVSARNIHFGACWMGSDRHITVCEQTLGKVALITLAQAPAGGGNGSGSEVSAAVERLPYAAEAAMVNPEQPLLAWKDAEHIHIVDLTSRKEIKALKLQAQVALWKWVSATTIAIVTDIVVLHWNIGCAQPVRVLELSPALQGAQIINYQLSPSGRSCLVGGVVVKAGGEIDGVMQLCTVESGSSEILHGHCGIFASIAPPAVGRGGSGAVKGEEVDVLIYEDKTSAEHTHLCIRETDRPRTAQGDPFYVTSQPLSTSAPDVNKSDFPVTMTYSAAQGLVYMLTRLGYLSLYDVYSAKTLHRSRVTEETVFCAAPHTATGGVLAVARSGQVLLVSLNTSNVIPYLVEHLGDPQLVISLATRLGISGAEELCAQHDARFNAVGDVVKYEVSGNFSPDGVFLPGAVPAECRPVVVCLDIGSTHCGVAVGYSADPQKQHCGAPTMKDALEVRVPASLLQQEDGSWEFGNDAEKLYYELLINVAELSASRRSAPVHLYRHIQEGLKGKFSGLDTLQGTSLSGHTHSLLDLFTRLLTYLKGYALDKAALSFGTQGSSGEDAVQWVITVPAVWNDFAKSFVRRAALQAGLITEEASDALMLVPEPESAALAVHLNSPEAFLLCRDRSFVMVDCGGSSVDVSVHELKCADPLDLSVVGRPVTGDWGGDQVGLEFKRFLKEMLGAELYSRLEHSYPYDFHTIYSDFDAAKVAFQPDAVPAAIRLGDVMDRKLQLLELVQAYNNRHPDLPVLDNPALRNGFLTMSNALMLSFFDPALALIVGELSRVLVAHPEVSVIVLVGGFGASAVLIERLQATFESSSSTAGRRVPVLSFPDRSTAKTTVAQGGVYWGLYKSFL